MGLLDPKIDRPRTFELLRKKGAVKAVLMFAGGHDEGGVDEITLYDEHDNGVALPTWYCGGYSLTGEAPNYTWVPLSTPQNEDEELADLLEGPINERYGSWGGVPSTEGTLIWNVLTEEVRIEVSQETWEHEEVIL